MFHSVSSCQLSRVTRQRGSSLVIAIFILVVMLLLGVALTRVLSTSSETIAFEVVGTRAFQAANVGVQQRLSEIFPLDGNTFYCDGATDVSLADPSAGETTQNDYIVFAQVDGLQNCKVATLTCDDFKVDDVVYYQITAEGQCSLGGEVTSRTVEVEARSL